MMKLVPQAEPWIGHCGQVGRMYVAHKLSVIATEGVVKIKRVGH